MFCELQLYFDCFSNPKTGLVLTKRGRYIGLMVTALVTPDRSQFKPSQSATLHCVLEQDI